MTNPSDSMNPTSSKRVSRRQACAMMTCAPAALVAVGGYSAAVIESKNMISKFEQSQFAQACPVEALALEAEAVAARLSAIKEEFECSPAEFRETENSLSKRLNEIAEAALDLRARSVRGASYQLLVADHELWRLQTEMEFSARGVDPAAWRSAARIHRAVLSALSVLAQHGGYGFPTGAGGLGIECYYMHSEQQAFADADRLMIQADAYERVEGELGIDRRATSPIEEMPLAYKVAHARELTPEELASATCFGEEVLRLARVGTAA